MSILRGIVYRKAFGDNVQAVIATHVDKEHLHNHILINTYGIDGHKFNDNYTTRRKLRDHSDRVCLAFGVPYIEPKHKRGMTYGEWNALRKGTSWKEKIRREIDTLVLSCKKFDELAAALESKGYTIKYGAKSSIKAPGQQRFTRFATLGDDYTIENIKSRILWKDDLGNASREDAYNKGQALTICFASTITQLAKRVVDGTKKPNKRDDSLEYLPNNDRDVFQLGAQLALINKLKIHSISEVHTKIEEAQKEHDKAVKKFNALTKEQHRLDDLIKQSDNYCELEDKTDKTLAEKMKLQLNIYPADMTREAIYGKKDTQAEGGFQEADSSTKIVTTLKEARKSLGLNVDGSLNADVYPTSFGSGDKLDLSTLKVAIENGAIKDSTVFKKSEGTSAPSNGFQTISDSCVIKGKLLQHADHRQPAYEFRKQTEIGQIVSGHLREQFPLRHLMIVPGCAETAFPGTQALRHDVVKPHERAATDEQDVSGINPHGLHLAVLAGSLYRHGGDGAFQDLEQCLLHALAGHIACDGRVLAAFTGDFVDLIYIYDALLSAGHVAVSGLNEALQHGFDVIPHIAGLRQCGGVGYDERHVHNLGKRLRQIRFAHSRRPKQQNIRFGHLHSRKRIILRLRRLHAETGGFAHFHVDALVMVVHGHGKRSFGRFLSDDVIVEIGADLRRLGQLQDTGPGVLDPFLRNDVHAQSDAFVADGRARPGNQLAHLVLGFAAERAS